MKLFDKEDEQSRNTLREQAREKRAVQKKNDDGIGETKTQPTKVVKESASNLDDTDDSPLFNTYMGELGKY